MTTPRFSHRSAVAYQERTGLHPTEAAGLRRVRFARSTGTLVAVYASDEAGIESDPDLPFTTVCEEHGRLVCHETLALAEHHATDPAGWCGVCNGTEQEDDAQ